MSLQRKRQLVTLLVDTESDPLTPSIELFWPNGERIDTVVAGDLSNAMARAGDLLEALFREPQS